MIHLLASPAFNQIFYALQTSPSFLINMQSVFFNRFMEGPFHCYSSSGYDVNIFKIFVISVAVFQ